MDLPKEMEEITHTHTRGKGRRKDHLYCIHLEKVVQSAIQKGQSLEAGIRWDKTGLWGRKIVSLGSKNG